MQYSSGGSKVLGYRKRGSGLWWYYNVDLSLVELVSHRDEVILLVRPAIGR